MILHNFGLRQEKFLRTTGVLCVGFLVQYNKLFCKRQYKTELLG
jgi:hypothetical protein